MFFNPFHKCFERFVAIAILIVNTMPLELAIWLSSSMMQNFHGVNPDNFDWSYGGGQVMPLPLHVNIMILDQKLKYKNMKTEP